MKPLEFHSIFEEEEARFAIFSTYEFDPVHFEKYLLWTTPKAISSLLSFCAGMNQLKRNK